MVCGNFVRSIQIFFLILLLFKLCSYSINFYFEMLSLFFLYYHYYFFLPPSLPFLSLLSRYPCLSSYFGSEIQSHTGRWADCLSGNILIIRISIFPSLLHVFRFHTKGEFTVLWVHMIILDSF